MQLQITLSNDNKVEIVEVESFDIQGFSEEMKSNESPGIAIGNQYFWKIDIRHVKELASETAQE